MTAIVNIALHVLNLIVGILTFISGLLNLIFFSFKGFIFGLYLIAFAILLIVSDFKEVAGVEIQFGFLTHMYGRGGFYLFLGFFVLEYAGYGLVAGLIIITAAVACFVLGIMGFEYPSPYFKESQSAAPAPPAR